MRVAHYQLSNENLGLLNFLFPGWPIMREPLSPFAPGKRVIVVSEREKDFYPDKQVIQISRRGDLKLDEKEGFVEWLVGRGYRISKEQREVFVNQEDEEFWALAKRMHVLGKFIPSSLEKSTSTFEIFVNLFEDYSIVYPLYRRSGVNYRMLFSSLLTMMLKTQVEETVGISPGYKKALLKNKIYFNHFKKVVLNYLESSMAERDFLTLLVECSEAKRG